MKHFKLLFLIPVLFILCGCNSSNELSDIEKQLEENRLKLVESLQDNNIVTSYNCPKVYVSPSYWNSFYVVEKEAVAKAFVTKCNSTIFIKDSFTDKNLMKCTKKKCKMFN